MENSKCDYWILHKKLFYEETFTFIHICTHICDPTRRKGTPHGFDDKRAL